ncbi:hemolymph protein [Danaus plexippus plexippus]|uniref:Hemolymph protein n=1 Tax=Danaus plexippus plexippus TaxID=278856 RepID=A0A212F195_DANPL|nr:hemolymph protein [Danaus plexippus plexippus]
MLNYFLLFVCIGTVLAQEPSLDDALASLPPELQGKVDENQINELKNKSVQLFQKKCDENGGLDAFPKAENAFQVFKNCIQDLVNPEVLQKEIKDATPTGQVDEVFKKYCYKKPDFKGCFQNMTETIKPCFSVEEQKNLKTIYNISEQLAEFICFKDGDRIALFISENGPECITEKQEAIEECFNKTLGADLKIHQENFSIDNLPKIQFTDKECGQFADLQKCVVSSLESCEAPTSANIMESLFKFARKATPCKELPENDSTARGQKGEKGFNSANTLTVRSFAMVAILFSLII